VLPLKILILQLPCQKIEKNFADFFLSFWETVDAPLYDPQSAEIGQKKVKIQEIAKLFGRLQVK